MADILHGKFTSEVGGEITQLGEALLLERVRKLAANPAGAPQKSGIVRVDPNKGDYPELKEGFKMRTGRGAHVAVFSEANDPSRFQRKPLAIAVCLEGPIKRSPQVREWYDNIFAGAIAQLWGRYQMERQRDHLTTNRYANAEATLRASRANQPLPLDYKLANYRPDFVEGSGFIYKSGFVVVMQFPGLAFSVCSQNGVGIEGCVVVRGFNLPIPMDEELTTVLGITQALGQRVVPQQTLEAPPKRPLPNETRPQLSLRGSRRGPKRRNR